MHLAHRYNRQDKRFSSQTKQIRQERQITDCSDRTRKGAHRLFRQNKRGRSQIIQIGHERQITDYSEKQETHGLQRLDKRGRLQIIKIGQELQHMDYKDRTRVAKYGLHRYDKKVSSQVSSQKRELTDSTDRSAVRKGS